MKLTNDFDLAVDFALPAELTFSGLQRNASTGWPADPGSQAGLSPLTLKTTQR